MKRHFLLIFSVFSGMSLIAGTGEAWSAGGEASNCREPFLSLDVEPFPFTVTSDRVREFFADRKNIIKYGGREGYLLFAMKTSNSNRMDYIFNMVSKALGRDRFRKLHWQQFRGSAEEFRDLRGKILNAEGDVREEYRTMEGYARFAAEHNNGDMFKTFVNMSAVLDKQEFQQTGWQSFRGSVEEFQDLRGKILDEKGNVREEYRTMEGYALFAARHYNGAMFKAFQNVSAALGQKFQQTGWQQFQGAVEDFRDLRGKILDAEGKVRKEYRTMEGYARFAAEHNNGDMFKTFLNMSAVLDKQEFKQTGWQSFRGSVEDFRDLRGKILDEKGNVREEYRTQEGYALFAAEHNNGDMFWIFTNVSAALDRQEFQQTGWQSFRGSVEEFWDLRGKILDAEGKVREEYRTQEGYALFAAEHNNGDMFKTFVNMSAVLDRQEFQQTGWQAFHGSVEEFQDIRGKILDEKGNVQEEYRTMEGYALFAAEHNNGDMFKTFLNMSAVLDKLKFKQTGWQSFRGSVEEFRDLKGKILDEKGNVRKEYRTMAGQAVFADRHYSGDMFKAFKNVSAVLGGASIMRQLDLTEWKSFRGSSIQYRELVRLFKPEMQDDASLISSGEISLKKEKQLDRMPFQGAEG